MNGGNDSAKVLIIDDEDAARFGISRALANQGYVLDEAADGNAALLKIEQFQPDVIVSDINMPGMDGLALLRRVNQNSEAPLVVLITAYGSEEVAVEALRAGAYNYISKPFDVEELRLIVRNALDKQRLLRENRYYYRELERTLAELKRSQAALVQAEKIAALGRLVAGVAHEINTPLGVLQSNTNLIERATQRIEEWSSNQPPETAGAVKRLVEALATAASLSESACARIGAIVENLRHFARLDEADFQRADIHDGIESALALLQHEFGDRIEVVREFGTLPKIDCYPRQLNQLFMNLLANAIEAIRRGSGQGSIRIRTCVSDDGVKIEIADNGCGIPEADLKRIFDPGFTTKGAGVGTGLGLAICYQVVQAHRGTIEVESRAGEGARFIVMLPSRGPG